MLARWGMRAAYSELARSLGGAAGLQDGRMSKFTFLRCTFTRLLEAVRAYASREWTDPAPLHTSGSVSDPQARYRTATGDLEALGFVRPNVVARCHLRDRHTDSGRSMGCNLRDLTRPRSVAGRVRGVVVHSPARRWTRRRRSASGIRAGRRQTCCASCTKIRALLVRNINPRNGYQ